MRKRNIKKQFWLSEEEVRKLRLNSVKTGLSESDYIRFLILDYQPKALPPKELYDLIMEIRKIGFNVNQIAKKVNSIGNLDMSYFKYEIEKLNNIVDDMNNKYINNKNSIE